MVYLNIDEMAFVCSRQYPFDNLASAKVVRETLERLLANRFSLPHVWKIISDKRAVKSYVQDNIDKMNYPLHYNDVLNDFSCKLIYNKEMNNKELISIVVGSHPTCPVCGKHTLEKQGSPVCRNCYNNLRPDDDYDYDELD